MTSSLPKPFQCKHCGLKNHLELFCPTHCFNCGQEGHFADTCHKTICASCGIPGHIRQNCWTRCYRCGLKGHNAQQCYTRCDRCLLKGHIWENCRTRCYLCGLRGHISRDCATTCFCCGKRGHISSACELFWKDIPEPTCENREPVREVPRKLTGGDFREDLNEDEINNTVNAMRIMTDVVWKAGSNEHWTAQKVITEMHKPVARGKQIYIPYWCRHHWLLVRINPERTHADIYDSARSIVVAKDVEDFCRSIGLVPVFWNCPQQIRDSRECGVFALCFLRMLTWGWTPNHGRKVSLAKMRDVLAKKQTLTREMIEGKLAGGETDAWQDQHDRFEAAAARHNLCYMLTATMMLNKYHEATGQRIMPWRVEALLQRRDRLGFLPRSEEDPMDVISRLREAGETDLAYHVNARAVSAKCEWMIWRTNNNHDQTPNGWRTVASIIFVGNMTVGKHGNSANSGHFTYRSGMEQGVIRLLRRQDVTSPVQPPANDAQHSSVTTREKQKKTTQPATEVTAPKAAALRKKGDNKTDRADEERRKITMGRPKRHGAVTAVRNMLLHDENKKKGMEATWSLGEYVVQMWGTATDIGIHWTMEKCECGEWRKMDEDDHVETACPIPTAQYFEAKITDTPTTACSCVKGDEVLEHEQTNVTTPAVDMRTEWTHQQEIEPLMMPYSAPASSLTGASPLKWYVYTGGRPKHVHHVVWNAMAQTTREQHVHWLLQLKGMPVDLRKCPLDNAIVELVLKQAQERKWAWSTIATKLSTIQTALRNLPIYTNEAKHIDLKESPYFSTAMTRAQKLARIAGPDTMLSQPLSYELFNELMTKCTSLPLRTFLGVSWAFAARPADLRNVHPKDIGLPRNNAPKEPTKITFKHGKGGACWGPYTIMSVLPLNIFKDIRQLQEERRKESTLWTMIDQRGVAEIMASVGLNLRSIRRGALIHNANRGVEDGELQLLSGHKRLDTLMRYLGWGVSSSTATKAAKKRDALTGAGLKEDVRVTAEPIKMGPSSGYQGDEGRRVDDPPQMYPIRPPTRYDLGIAPEKETLPLHIKNVGTVDIEALRTMAADTPYREEWEAAVVWLKGKPFHELELRLPKKKFIPRSTFTEEQVGQLIDAGKIRAIKSKDGKCFANLFGVVDGDKGRLRVLSELFVNRYISRGIDYPELEYTSRAQRREQMLGCQFVAQFDYAAYFDQFAMEEDAQKFMVVRTREVRGNDVWALTKLPMGARFSPSVAQFSTWIVCDAIRKIPGVQVTTMIDNVRIAADKPENFVRAVRMFLDRSDEARMTLNPEANAYRGRSDQQLADMGRRARAEPFEFLGECFEGDTVRNTAKLVKKLQEAIQRVKTTRVALRHLAHTIGLIIYMAHTLNISMAEHFKLMRMYSNFFRGTPVWDSTVQADEDLILAIDEIATRLTENQPVRIQRLLPPSLKEEDYDAVVIFDACKNAWAARVHEVKTRKTLRLMKAFSEQVKFSAHAEPAAAKEVVQWCKYHKPEWKKVAVVTDHEALAKGQRRWWTGFGGHSTAWHINQAFRVMNGYAEIFHVEGKDNICDGDSRSIEAASARTTIVEYSSENWMGLTKVKHPFATYTAKKGF